MGGGIGIATTAIRLHRVTSKNSDYIFEEHLYFPGQIFPTSFVDFDRKQNQAEENT